MGFAIYMKKDGETVRDTSNTEGTMTDIFHPSRAELNVSFNLNKYFVAALPGDEGLMWLYGKTGREAQPHLQKAVEELGASAPSDPWDTSASNAGYYLDVLHGWSVRHPDAKFVVYK